MAQPTTYIRPTTLYEALREAATPNTLAVAGGALCFGVLDLPFERIVDLESVRELRQIEPQDDGLIIGAAVFLQELVESADVPVVLKRSLTRALSLNLRNRTSVGETLLVENPPSEWLAALAALEAYVVYVGPSPEQRYRESVETYLASRQRLANRSIVTQLVILPPLPRSAAGAAFVSRTPADAPIVCAAVTVSLTETGRVSKALAALCGASPELVVVLELDTLIGNPLDEANIASAVKSVVPRVNPVADYLGSADYRRDMARVLVQRALLDALAQL